MSFEHQPGGEVALAALPCPEARICIDGWSPVRDKGMPRNPPMAYCIHRTDAQAPVASEAKAAGQIMLPRIDGYGVYAV